MLKTWTALLILLNFSQIRGSEWITSKGEHCIDRCRYHDDANSFYWCHTSDPSRKYRRPDRTSSSDWDHWVGSSKTLGVDTDLKWDYCTPSRTEQQLIDEILGTTPGTLEVSPEPPTLRRPMTSLYPQTECTSRCERSGLETICDTSGDNAAAHGIGRQSWFYCAVERPLVRVQLSAVYRMWCVDSCRLSGSSSHFTCNTLYGNDYCSPRNNVGTKGGRCTSPCELYTDWKSSSYYFCYTSPDKKTWEYCGFHHAPEDKRHRLEFTASGAVCADFCQPEDKDSPTQKCQYVYWTHNTTLNEAELQRDTDYCLGFESPPLSTVQIVGVAIGIVAALIILCACCACCAARK